MFSKFTVNLMSYRCEVRKNRHHDSEFISSFLSNSHRHIYSYNFMVRRKKKLMKS
jgi:hypothetical protein